jgi:hypothetical protein
MTYAWIVVDLLPACVSDQPLETTRSLSSGIFKFLNSVLRRQNSEVEFIKNDVRQRVALAAINQL